MDVLARIQEALEAAASVVKDFTSGRIEAEKKRGGDPVTEADRAVNQALHALLPRSGEGWLSEETVDDKSRLDQRRVWVVDPLDGTKEFVTGIPEWCVSVGFVEDGAPIAGGIFNPATGEKIVGARGHGVLYNGEPAQMSHRRSLEGGLVLASRSEVDRGEWKAFQDADFEVRPVGSVAYKLGLVAAGRADATWTIVPKNEWDVAAGAALVLAAGGSVYEPEGELPEFNRENTLLRGLVANPKSLDEAVRGQITYALQARFR
ncbi:MAG TPA: 3'(2'),5'-bisphosphate nucleotidase CysQ [Vicinamibacteria bacterium]|nr:3'(2'),5'-bisphosphate nucleotidase CysQ [Vicinamibacteria bacterium]